MKSNLSKGTLQPMLNVIARLKEWPLHCLSDIFGSKIKEHVKQFKSLTLIFSASFARMMTIDPAKYMTQLNQSMLDIRSGH